jgi:hypothetical protein
MPARHVAVTYQAGFLNLQVTLVCQSISTPSGWNIATGCDVVQADVHGKNLANKHFTYDLMYTSYCG